MATEPVTFTDDFAGDITVGFPEPMEVEGDNLTSTAAALPDSPSTTTKEEVSSPGEGSLESPADSTTAEAPPPRSITIDPSKLDAEIARLQREDKEFANAFNRAVGNKAANKYKPEIDKIVLENKILAREIRKQEILQMTPQERAEKFRTDRAFADEYTSIVHADPEADRQAVDKIDFGAKLNNTFQSAIDDGIPADHAAKVWNDIRAGYFDRDENGNILSAAESVPYIVRALYRGLVVSQNGSSTPSVNSEEAATTPSAPSQASKQPQTNPNLLKGGPDTTTTGVTRATPRDKSIQDYQAALKAGKSWSSEDIDAITRKYLEME